MEVYNMSNWIHSEIYIKILNNSSDDTSRIDKVQLEEFDDEEEEGTCSGSYAEEEYGLEIGDDISEEEAAFIDGYNSDYEDFDSIDYDNIDLSNYELAESEIISYYEENDIDNENYNAEKIYLAGEERVYKEITLKDILDCVNIGDLSKKSIVVLDTELI
jgi:hypothetical protein